jgi:glycolate oxidase FAD binding subunit
MVGSLGKYGVLVELTFKVFPSPAASGSLRAYFSALPGALEALVRLSAAPLELTAIDLEMQLQGWGLLIRLGGPSEGIAPRLERLRALLGSEEGKVLHCEFVEGLDEMHIWRAANEFLWVTEAHSLVKVPLTPQRVSSLDERLAVAGAQRRYSVGANVAWVAWPGPVSELDALLVELGLPGLVVMGAPGRPLIGVQTGEPFARRVKQALDPQGKF